MRVFWQNDHKFKKAIGCLLDVHKRNELACFFDFSNLFVFVKYNLLFVDVLLNLMMCIKKVKQNQMFSLFFSVCR